MLQPLFLDLDLPCYIRQLFAVFLAQCFGLMELLCQARKFFLVKFNILHQILLFQFCDHHEFLLFTGNVYKWNVDVGTLRHQVLDNIGELAPNSPVKHSLKLL